MTEAEVIAKFDQCKQQREDALAGAFGPVIDTLKALNKVVVAEVDEIRPTTNPAVFGAGNMTLRLGTEKYYLSHCPLSDGTEFFFSLLYIGAHEYRLTKDQLIDRIISEAAFASRKLHQSMSQAEHPRTWWQRLFG